MELHAERESEPARLYRRWHPALMSFFLKRVKDHAEAEDLTQEVFAQVFGRGTGDPELHAGYIFQVASNLLRERARRTSEQAETGEDVGNACGQGGDWRDLGKGAATPCVLSELIPGLAALPEQTRTIFVLYRMENIDKHLIAESFGISCSAVEEHVARAMVHLMGCVREGCR